MSGQRLTARLAALAARDRAAFVAYMMAGDPDHDTSLEILRLLPAAGADIVEVGFPFSDPMADGPAIQASAIRSLAAGGSLRATLDLIATFRQVDHVTPIVLMGYTNPLHAWGFADFARCAAEVGVDGLIIVDLPPEEADPLANELDKHDISLIRLATPTSDEARLRCIAERASGFVYHVSVAGVTGAREANPSTVAPAVAKLRAATGLPVAVGFGVKTPERAAEIARIADAVVVGSALVEEIATALAENRPAATPVIAKAQSLATSVQAARNPAC